VNYIIKNNNLVENKGVAPKNGIFLTFKDFSLTVRCAATFSQRMAKFDNMVMDLLNKNLYTFIKPKSIYSGTFEVIEGFEDVFKSIAENHGFGACELIECQ